jgi:hypothetical protein
MEETGAQRLRFLTSGGVSPFNKETVPVFPRIALAKKVEWKE